MRTPTLIPLALTAMIPTASLADYAGGYAGLSFGLTANNQVTEGSFSADLEDDGALGIFGGLRAYQGNLIYGGEVAISNVSNLNFEDVSGFDDIDVTIIDLKISVGTELSGVLAYGILGFSNFNTSDDNITDEENASGFAIGAGAMYDLGNNFQVGAEYLIRRAEFDNDIELEHDTFTLRAAYSF
ncbi:MAG: outer membrane beta-barrel protein [Pseudomonadota bacterium]